MATTFSLSLSPDLQPHHRHLHQRHHPTHFHPYTTKFATSKHTHPTSLFPKPTRPANLLLTCSTLQDPLRTGPGPFLLTEDLQNLQTLNNFKYFHKLPSGYVLIRLMQEQELDMIVGLLAESFAESMLMPKSYVIWVGFLVKQYLMERRKLMPHTATLIGYFTDDSVVEDGQELDVQLAGTVEVNFDKRGANTSPPTPTPPRDCPYICNMTVSKSLRRRGIGWHLLKASEELISKMSISREVYLHCRVIDSAPLNMYTKAGYSIVKTDNILILLTLQRRKHLMHKQLPPASTNLSESDVSCSDEEHPS